MPLANSKMERYPLLTKMYSDTYYPQEQVKKGEAILRGLCARIEAKKPANLTALYVLTEEAIKQSNTLEKSSKEQNSEIETVARDAIGSDFLTIAHAYGHNDADSEALIAAREW
ncbi:MAG: DUF5713 family protein [Cardiobacteriaceae bacterium]|nr:DUF5713 family protein [Cardiobacteriaceae bacterium]